MWSDVVEAETRRIPAVSGVVAVVGLGRGGLPLAAQCALRGWRVVGYDSNPQVVDCIKNGRVPGGEDPELEGELPSLVERGLLTVSLHASEAVARANIVVVLASVQISEAHQIRFQELDAVTETIGRAMQPGSLVCYQTALPVGTTAGRLRTRLENCSGLDASRDFFLAYSCEPVSSGHMFRDLLTYPRIVGGIDARSTQVVAAFYRSILPAEILSMPSAAEAEFAKLIETTYRDVNIALANEFACYADEHNLDVMAAIAAANTQPSVSIHQPGVGVGGHAIPVYPYLLINHAPASDAAEEPASFQSLRLTRAARSINDGMAEYAVQRIEAAAGSLWRRSVLLLGIASQSEARETTFSSAYLLQAALWRHGATVYVDDPLYNAIELQAFGFQPLPPGRENEIDAMILQTAHQAYQNFDFRRFSRCRLLLDGRHGLTSACVEEASIRYMTLGDGKDDAAQCLAQVRGAVRV